MAAPEISASIDVNAPVSKVWEHVTDLSAMGKRSPQCKKMILLKGRGGSSGSGAGTAGAGAGTAGSGVAPAPGSITVNLNRQGFLWWPTWAVVTEVQPGRVFEFKIPLNGSHWRFELTESADGSRTTLTEKRHIPGGNTSLISRALVATALGGEKKFEAGLQEGIEQTIRAIAREAEGL
ncbi:SRPBCC family protein [Corynebacterium macclintockiae]|uniref:SRPBCC family protein n=1 Tax=Corynebacterium macclintockiae TaxID=2913501 RepID=UPI00254E9A1B|nr:SRPBCC family protein [Corynebacterium macclintockiae]MDK8890010.1 SRPBCC family protein [Corynebacterium macclintockiae]